ENRESRTESAGSAGSLRLAVQPAQCGFRCHRCGGYQLWWLPCGDSQFAAASTLAGAARTSAIQGRWLDAAKTAVACRSGFACVSYEPDCANGQPGTEGMLGVSR